jgi:hypothetical protein
MKMRHWILLLANALFAASAWSAESGAMLKADELKAAPYRDAKTVSRLASGDKLDILKQQSGWYQVKSAKGTGWVRMLSVRRGAMRKGSEVAGLAGLATGRAGTGKVVASTGVRGLSEEDLKSAKFDASEIKKMEANTVSKDAARKFASQAQLKSIKLDYLPKPEGAEK